MCIRDRRYPGHHAQLGRAGQQAPMLYRYGQLPRRTDRGGADASDAPPGRQGVPARRAPQPVSYTHLIYRGFPVEEVVAQSCAHTIPTGKDELTVVGYLKAAAIIRCV